jgi:hypothetical protein
MPDAPNITEALLAATACGLVGKIIFDWMKNKKEDGKQPEWCKNCSLKSTRALEDIKWIREIHSPKDDSGLPLWYVPRDWGRTVMSVDEKVNALDSTLKMILAELKEHNKILLNLLTKKFEA